MPSEVTESDMNPVSVWLRGVGMGAADVVPGFSGGTVALITGIYERLIRAISRFDTEFLSLLLGRKYRQAGEHIDFRFLAFLIFGIFCGFAVSTFTIKSLLDSPLFRPYVLSAFIGMVLGSAWYVFASIRSNGPVQLPQIVLMGIGFVLAAGLSMLPGRLAESPPLWFIFLCGAVGICAMILPGISGALMLMVMGIYEPLMGTAKSLLKFENLMENLLVCLVFGLGCLTGLLGFSKLLRWLFATRPSGTLSVMFGLMLGAVVKLWPYESTGHHADQSDGVTSAEIWFPGVIATIAIFLAITLAFSAWSVKRKPRAT